MSKAIDEKKIKHMFRLIIKLITKEYFMNLLYYLFYPVFVTSSWLVDFI